MLIAKNNNGYMLLEIMVSIAIITIVLLPFISYFSNSLYVLSKTEMESQAYQFATSAVESLKMKSVHDWENMETYAGNFSLSDVSTNNDLFTDDFNIAVTINDFDFNSDGNIDSDDSLLGKKLSVVVSWNEGKRDIQIDTLLRKR